MYSPDDISRLRKSVPDSVLMDELAKQDAGFAEVVTRYKTVYQNPDPFTAYKAPSYLINRYYFKEFKPGRKTGPAAEQTGQLIHNMARDTQQKTLGGFVGNVAKSGAQFVGDIANAAMHPFQTGEAIGKTIIGGAANTVETLTGNENLFNLESEEMASQVGTFFKERYGSAEALGNTMYNDPVGFLADLSSVLGLAGGAVGLAGKAGNVSKAARIGSKMTSIANTMDPALAAGRAVSGLSKAAMGAPAKTAQSLVKKALNLKPSDIEKIKLKSVAGVKPEKWLIEKGLIDEFGDTPESIGTKLRQLRDTAKKTKDEGLAKIQNRYDIKAKTGDAPAHRVGQALDVLEDLYKSNPAGNEDKLSRIAELKRKRMLSLSEIDEVQHLGDIADQIFKGSGDERAGVKVEGLANIRKDIKSFIEHHAAANGMDNVKQLKKDTQVAHEIEDAIAKSEYKRETPHNRNLVDIAIAGFVGIGLDFPTAIGVVAAKRILESPRVKLSVATAIKKLSKAEKALLTKYSATRKLDHATRAVLQKLKQSIDAIPDALAPSAAESLLVPERSQ